MGSKLDHPDRTLMNAKTSAAAPLDALPLRLTSFSHGGGCGCKIAPGVLSEILRSSGGGMIPPELMVGTAASSARSRAARYSVAGSFSSRRCPTATRSA